MEYAKSKDLYINYYVLDIPQDRSSRPKIDEVISFYNKGIKTDSPVAFFKSVQRRRKKLYRWHWVTIAEIDIKDIDNAIICVFR